MSKMDYDKSAKQIVKYAGGEGNILSLMHCTTRLRFVLNDFDKADVESVKQVPGVMGATVSNGQFQVVIGNQVAEMYDAVEKVTGGFKGNARPAKSNAKWYQVLLEFIIAVFQPLIPAIAGGGVLKSMLMLFAMFGWMSDTSTTYQVLTMAGNAPIYFLPLLVAITTAKRLRVNELVAMSVVSVLVLPDMVTALAKGVKLFGMTATNVTYSSQVLPAILAVLFYAGVEKLMMKYSPKSTRMFLVPMVGIAVTVPVTLLFLGPAGYVAGQGFTSAILWLYKSFGWVAMAILAAVLPLLVATGMHKPFVPYVVASLGSLKKEMLYLPASLAHNISEAGTCFAITIRTKDAKLRSTTISGGISALCGITEPAIYGITLQNKRALFSVMGSSFVGGAFIGIIGLHALAPVGPGLASLAIFVDKSSPANIIHALWGFGVSFVLSFVVSLFTWKDSASEEIKEEAREEEQESPVAANAATAQATAQATATQPSTSTVRVGRVKMEAPVAGKVEPLSAVEDEVFSSGMMGDGFAVEPTDDTVRVPVSGTVAMVYNTGHAFGIKTEAGAEVLVHIGIDTVKLNGQYFDMLLKEGQQVKAGDPAVRVDFAGVEKADYKTSVMVVVTMPGEEEFDFPVVTA